MDLYCWRLCEAVLCVGIACEIRRSFLQIAVLVVWMRDSTRIRNAVISFPPSSQPLLSTFWARASDVHLRNAMILQTYPQFLYFSLRTVAFSISSYAEFRWIQEHQDYSRLKQRCRQKFLQETVTKILVVKGSVILTDLLRRRIGQASICTRAVVKPRTFEYVTRSGTISYNHKTYQIDSVAQP
ncbi:uncharacterized protein LACBIDRAFT_309834 [Laccaria bicolor S238N-H82]|uniref:Predicted protein n=1 Tax=Laccaria bicolor (strain S238N-H82 / ATCC MYA-4686) TaxID=486041 RepID=B0DT59_LACBS|nr:uncharacterized protein LACBIDRAFT_309834 [Laccaria bicolor S238N-H82]EDR02164.1 predicted protein [Laccaria bicolor S238N-H82]|eukprot:XP_001887109.1 predicted protein [Laccaria bicolor S238N-H82]